MFTLLPLLSGKGKKHHGEILKEATKLAERGLLKPVLDSKTYYLNTVEEAYTAIANRLTDGKVVIEI